MTPDRMVSGDEKSGKIYFGIFAGDADLFHNFNHLFCLFRVIL